MTATRVRLRFPGAVALLILLAAPAAAQMEEITEEKAQEGAGLALVDEEAPPAETAEEPPPEQPAEEEPLAPEPITRITFDVPFAPEKGGGSARGSAGALPRPASPLGRGMCAFSEA